MLISSTQNPRIKQVLALSQKSTERRSTGLIVVEGHRELLHCVNSGAQVQAVFYCPAIYNASRG
jgi:TrmH family RNA methyltransferase